MKFRKKPVVIKAEQYKEYGKLVKGMCNSQSCFVAGNTKPHVHTIHDNQIVNLEVGDYIIPEPDGIHYYPCKPDIFVMTYEPESTPKIEAEGKELPTDEEICKQFPMYDDRAGLLDYNIARQEGAKWMRDKLQSLPKEPTPSLKCNHENQRRIDLYYRYECKDCGELLP